MNTRRLAVALTVLVGQAVAVTFVAQPANATPPDGDCTRSYGTYVYDGRATTYPALQGVDPGAEEVASIVDANHNGVICFKLYPNGDHNGHLGNLVDDTAAPHV